MGNSETKASTLAKRKNYSFDAGEFSNFNIDKIKPIKTPHNNISSSLDLKPQHQAHISMPSIMMKQSSSFIPTSRAKLSQKQQSSKLQKLTRTNDELRKQLIDINKKLSEQLERKKIPTLMKGNKQKANDQIGKRQGLKQTKANKFNIIALKKQLQNAYDLVTSYKKHLQSLKKNESLESNQKLSQHQNKILPIDQEIQKVQKQLDSIKDVVEKQRQAIKGFQNDMEGEHTQENKKEIIRLKDRLKKFKEVSKKKEREENMRHDLLFQMERKLRQVNGDYIPQFKNWANEPPESIKQSRILQKNQLKAKKPKETVNTQQKQPIHIPSLSQFQQLSRLVSSLKKTHEQFHKKINIELRKRNDFKQLRLAVEQKIVVLQKTLQNLNYKKNRYLQVVVNNPNVEVDINLMDRINDTEEEDESLQGGVITRGWNLQKQVEFSDKKMIKNYHQTVDNLKIVTINIWTCQKNNIIAFQFYYTDGESLLVGMKSQQINVVSQKHTIEIGQDDYVKNVIGEFNIESKFLQFIVFQSLKGKTLKVGRELFGKDRFSLRMKENQRIAMITGASTFDGSCWRINRLDFLLKQ